VSGILVACATVFIDAAVPSRPALRHAARLPGPKITLASDQLAVAQQCVRRQRHRRQIGVPSARANRLAMFMLTLLDYGEPILIGLEAWPHSLELYAHPIFESPN
jgi:hypothetical protein